MNYQDYTFVLELVVCTPVFITLHSRWFDLVKPAVDLNMKIDICIEIGAVSVLTCI